MKNYKAQAESLAGKGRYGDTTLMHVNEAEVEALEGIAGLFGRELTENPDTGLKEAFNLFDILPFALNFIFPGMGTAAQIGIGALSGAASGAVEGNDPLMGALTGGAMSGIGSALFGGADVPGMIPGADTAAAKTLVEGPLGTGVSQAALESADVATKAAAEQAMSSLAGSKAPGFWDADFTMRDFGADSGLNRWLADPMSKGNLPYTLAGGAAAASLMDNFNPFGTDQNVTKEEDKNRAHLRNPAAPRPYQPLNTPDLNTYGQLGSDYQSEVNYFLNNPGPYTGSPYEGDPYAYPFKEGGLACYADGDVVTQNGNLAQNQSPAVGGGFQSAIQLGQQHPLISKIMQHNPAMGGALSMMRAKGSGGKGSNGQTAAAGQPQLTPQQQMIARGVPASLANMPAVTGGQNARGGQFQNRGGRVPRVPQKPDKGGNVSAPGFITTPTQITPQQPIGPVASPMPVGQPSFNPVNFNPITSFQPPAQTLGQPASFAPVTGFAGGGGIASMGGGAVDPRIIEQLMAGGGGEIEGSDPGMADTIPASIDGQQPARLSSGEYVVPADVVSMLGDGNTKAGAQVLRSMVERVRLHKTGSAGQAAEIDQTQVLPA